MDTTMQSPVRLPIPYSGGTEIVIPTGPHYYSTRTWVGSTSNGVTPQEAFDSLSRHATPFQSRPSVDGGKVSIPGLGTVRQLVDPDRLTIVNTTEPDHLLYPGNVHRSIVQDGDDLYVETRGYGTGILPGANEHAAPLGWNYEDGKIFRELNPQAEGYPMDEMNIVAGTGSHNASTIGPASPPDNPPRGIVSGKPKETFQIPFFSPSR